MRKPKSLPEDIVGYDKGCAFFAVNGVPYAKDARNLDELEEILKGHLSAIYEDTQLAYWIREYLRRHGLGFNDRPSSRQ